MNCDSAGRGLSTRFVFSTLLTLILILNPLAGNVIRVLSQEITPQTVQVVDLGSTAAGIQVLGPASESHLTGNGTAGNFDAIPRARALATGDINHDGISDLIVGAPEHDFTPQGGAARANAGAVYVIFGKSTFTPPVTFDTIPGSTSQPDVAIFGGAAGDHLGFAVAAGDVNGDGIDDLVLGAPGFDLSLTGPPPVSRPDAGAIFVFFGSDTFPIGTVDLAAAGAANLLIAGEHDGDAFGSSIAIGNVNSGTSAPDLLAGAPASKGPDPAGAARDNGGAAYLLLGGTGLANPDPGTKRIDLADGAAVARIFGKAQSQLGSAVAIGDVNGSSPADLLLGAPTADRPAPGTPAAGAGAVFGISGGSLTPTPPATSKTFDINADQQALSIYGEVADDHFGSSIAAGDVDGDGTADIAAGAPDSAGPFGARLLAGEVYLIKGGPDLSPSGGATEVRIDVSLTTVALIAIGAVAGDHLGSAVAVGAVNGPGNTDAVPDILLGAPGALTNGGIVYVLFGGATLLRFPARDFALGQDDARILGQADGNELGWAITAGDFDHNGGGDLAVGAPFANVQVPSTPVRSEAGKAYVLLAATETAPPHNQDPTVALTLPNGGESLPGGSGFTITWTASDPDGDDTLQHFEITLSTDGGATFNTTINSDIPGTSRTFNWSIPFGINTTTARIRITAFDGAGGTAHDDSDANFTITDAGVLVVLTAPNGGEDLKFDQVVQITWVVGAGFDDLVRGFDLFYTTDNGTTFTPITPVNPTQPALAKDVRTFDWTVPRICSTSVKAVIRTTSTTGGVSSDSSNAPFSISERTPTIDTTSMDFSNNKKLNFRLVGGTTPLFVDGVKLEISADVAGTQFFEAPVHIKNSGTKLQTFGRINGQKVGVFFPDGASRVVRITQGTCAVITLHVHRVGSNLVPDSTD